MNLLPSFKNCSHNVALFYVFLAALICLVAWGIDTVERGNEKAHDAISGPTSTFTVTGSMQEDYAAWEAQQICFTDAECEAAYVEAMNKTCNHVRECEENFDFEAYIADWQEGRQK